MFVKSPSNLLRSSRQRGGQARKLHQLDAGVAGMVKLLAAVFGVEPPPQSVPKNVSLLFEAFEAGIRQTYPAPLGSLLARAVEYCHKRDLDRTQLQTLVDLDSSAILNALFKKQGDRVTMRLISCAMVGSAMLSDRHGVDQWAQAGLTHCTRVGGDWASTTSEWQWVLANTGDYILYIEQLRHFFVPE